mmetsp:Transcript_18175/g.20220  ORF Transcript_18175/g.20220 Transcript_18175/m.20220 type:complete len:91 (-) Transcript_18175:108-380(-)
MEKSVEDLSSGRIMSKEGENLKLEALKKCILEKNALIDFLKAALKVQATKYEAIIDGKNATIASLKQQSCANLKENIAETERLMKKLQAK